MSVLYREASTCIQPLVVSRLEAHWLTVAGCIYAGVQVNSLIQKCFARVKLPTKHNLEYSN